MAKREDELSRFVREALSKGIARTEIKTALLEAGWSAEQADAALNAYSEIAFAIPVPAPRQYVSAREAYLYLVLFTTLFIAAFGLGSLVFNFIEQAFPDPVRRDFRSDASIRWSMSLLIVAAPIFLFTAHRIRRMLLADRTKLGSPVRKWLTYIALFIAAAFIIGDVTTLVYWVLSGELTVRFLLKVATVAVISGAIFGYYLYDLRRDEQAR